MTQVTINGNTYSDDGSTAKDMRNGGHRTHFFPLVQDVVTVAGQVQTTADQVSIDAVNAADGANAMRGTSTTSTAVGTGTKTFTTQAGKQFTGGNYVTVSRTGAPTTLMHGVVTSYSSTTLTVDVSTIAGSGTYTDWTIALSGAKGNDGPSGTGDLPYVTKTSAYTVLSTDKGKLIDCTSGTFTQTFVAAATLGNGWWCYLRNSGDGDITLDPNGAELIDGVSGYVLYPGECRLIQCDGATLRTLIVTPFCLTRRSGFDFLKPPGYSAFDVDLRGATGGGGSGGAGGYSTSASHAAGGGGASGGLGARCTAIFPAEILQPVTPFAVGAAGLGAAGVTAPAETPDGVIVNGVNGSNGGGTTVTIDGSTFIAGGGPGGSGGKGTSGASSGSPGGAVSAGVASMTGKYSTGQSANRYRYLGGASFGMSKPGVAGGFASGGARIPGGLGGLAVTDALASGSTGAGGGGGDSRLGGVESVSRPGLNGVHGMVIIKGVV